MAAAGESVVRTRLSGGKQHLYRGPSVLLTEDKLAHQLPHATSHHRGKHSMSIAVLSRPQPLAAVNCRVGHRGHLLRGDALPGETLQKGTVTAHFRFSLPDSASHGNTS